MNLRKVDLNLLTAFDALMHTRHVTRAAQYLGIGQPGMSAALARLRDMFDDELLVRQGGEMLPTLRATELAPQVRRILRQIEDVMRADPNFEPSSSDRRFTLRMSDLLSLILLPRMAARLKECAASIALEIVHLSPEDTVDALEKSDVELAVSTQLKVPNSIQSTTLLKDEIVLIARANHPAKAKMRRLKTCMTLPHIQVAQSPIDYRFIGQQTGVCERRCTAITVPHWLAVPEIVAASDLIAMMPRSIAERIRPTSGVDILTAPLPQKSFEWAVYWHRQRSADRGLIWLKEQILAAAGDE